MGIYTRRVKARILYNHIVASSLSPDFIRFLVEGESLPTIVDHANYNPRIIEWMTDPAYLIDVLPENYPEHFIDVLDHPKELWVRAFREHIPAKAQHLLISLYFLSEYGASLHELEASFQAVHAHLCLIHNLSSAPTDFQDAVKLLEGSFISLRNREVSFVNPSVRDYLEEYLSDVSLLVNLAPTAQSAEWAQELWRHYRKIGTQGSISPSSFAELFCDVARRFKDFQAWRRTSQKPIAVERSDLAITERISLLAEWLDISGNKTFATSLFELASNPSDTFSAWLDGTTLPHMIDDFRSGRWMHLPGAEGIADYLERHLIQILKNAPPSDDLDSITGIIQNMNGTNVSENVLEALREAINSEIENTAQIVDELDAETELKDHAMRIQKLAAWASIDGSSAVRIVDVRLQKLKEKNIQAEKPSFPTGKKHDCDDFDDKSLKHLFEGLLDV